MASADKLHEKILPVGESTLHRGEKLLGVVAATSAKLYGGKTYVIVVTDKRLVFQPTGAGWEPMGRAIPLHPDEIEEYEMRGMAPRALRGPLKGFSKGGFRVDIKTTDDRPFQLMGWTGEGPLGRMGGGKAQSEGVAALSDWLDAIDMGD